jgi:hypothetical protein
MLGVVASRQMMLLDIVICQDAPMQSIRHHRAYTDIVM